MSNKYISRDNLEFVIDGLKIGTQADWNENDKTAAGYIRNRPFYTNGEEIYQIDEKYIPDSIARAEDVEAIIEVNSQKMDATNPVGTGSFSMGRKADTEIGKCSHAEGHNTEASGDYSHAEGVSVASGDYSHAEGGSMTSSIRGISTASGTGSHAEGISTASGDFSHAEGRDTTASGQASHAEGYSTIALTFYSHAEGQNTEASGQASHAEGCNTEASNLYSHAEGDATTTSGQASHAEGRNTTASGEASHAEGRGTTASGDYSHAEGFRTEASNLYSHAEGQDTEASGKCSHAEGSVTRASGDFSHAEGNGSRASGYQSHAEGCSTVASGAYSHAEGMDTTASGYCSHVQGRYNIEDTEEKYVHIVGNGTGYSDGAWIYSNAHTLDWEGNAWYQGDIYVGSTSGTNRDEGSKKLATEECVYSPKHHFTLIDDTTSYEYIIRMQNGNLTSICKASSLAVTTLPTKTTYTVGEALDLTDMVVTLTRQDGATEAINNYSYTEPDMSVAGTVDVTVSYVEVGETYSATFTITINEATTTEETESETTEETETETTESTT